MLSFSNNGLVSNPIKKILTDNEKVYVIGFENSIKIFNKDSGKLLSTLMTNFDYIRDVAIDDRYIYIIGESSNSGISVWKKEGHYIKTLQENSLFNSITIANEFIYAINGNVIDILDMRKDGQTIFSIICQKAIKRLFVSENNFYLVTKDTIEIRDVRTGLLIKKLKIPGLFPSLTTVIGKTIYYFNKSYNRVGFWDGKRKGETTFTFNDDQRVVVMVTDQQLLFLLLVSLEEGINEILIYNNLRERLSLIQLATNPSSITVDDRILIIGSNDGTIIAYNKKDFKIKWIKKDKNYSNGKSLLNLGTYKKNLLLRNIQNFIV